MRLDKYLVDKGYFKTRNKALTAIKNGAVLVAGSTIFKPSYEVLDSLDIKINTNLLIPYVSRGGLKLETAIKSFNLNFQNKVVLDIGSSTGGFTDCAIKHGAKLVYAVDVGTNQLDESLKSNAKVVSLENTNILSLPFFSNSIDIVLLDCSFVSVNVLLPAINNYVTENNGDIAVITKETVTVLMNNFSHLSNGTPLTLTGAGIIGCFLAVLFSKLFAILGTYIVTGVIIALGIFFSTGLTFSTVWKKITSKVDLHKPKGKPEKIEMLNSMLNSVAGLFEITNTNRELGEVYLRNVFTKKEYCVTDIGLSSNFNNETFYMYMRIITYDGISFGTGLNLIFNKKDKFICNWIKENLKEYNDKQEMTRFQELYNEFERDNKGIKLKVNSY